LELDLITLKNKTMKTLRISIKSFDRAIWGFFRKRVLLHPSHIHMIGNIADFIETIEKLSKTYSSKPFKKKSTYVLKDVGENKKTFKVGYIFDDDKLYFKLFVFTGLRYKRLTQLVIHILKKTQQ
jgi:hypothetical protein